MITDINRLLKPFIPISLDAMNGQSLMKRVDTKFILNRSNLYKILPILQQYYQILEIDNKRWMTYRTQYLDTHDFEFYNDHHRGKPKRVKIRIRNYTDAGLFYYEIKKKDGRGNTNKSRVQITNMEDWMLPKVQDFTYKMTGKNYVLAKSIRNQFKRFTLVSVEMKERATIDTNLRFWYNNDNFEFDQLAIIELKQAATNWSSPLYRCLKKFDIRANSISKYCLGLATLKPDLKSNMFKSKLLKIDKITT